LYMCDPADVCHIVLLIAFDKSADWCDKSEMLPARMILRWFCAHDQL
jgi:hypothetical protein